MERQFNKQFKKLEIQERKTKRKRKCIKRLTVQAVLKAVKKVEKEQKTILKQLLVEAKQQKKRPYNKKKTNKQIKNSCFNLLGYKRGRSSEIQANKNRAQNKTTTAFTGL